MTSLSEAVLLAEARHLFATWFDQANVAFRGGRDTGVDLIVEHGRLRLAVEVKATSDSSAVGAAIANAKTQAPRVSRNAIPVVAVPYMGEVGRRLCAEADVCWFDLSGNARIVGPGLRIIIEGKPNKFLRRGRPSSAFAPKSARIARHLLIQPQRSFLQQELSRETGLDDGFTSRIVHRLEQDKLLDRAKDGRVKVANPDLLIDAWSEVYNFDKHTIVSGHVSARNSENLLAHLGKAMEDKAIRHAATGLGAAWLQTEFSGFRLVTFFVEERPTDVFFKEVGFRQEPKGANVWFVIPDDIGVFDGSENVKGIACVHAVQAYVDLLAHPERAKEAAAELRSRLLRWNF
jgi:hypothetical protein